MHRNLRRNLAAQLGNAQVLHNKGIHTGLGSSADEVGHGLELPVGDQGVEGQVDSHPPDVAVFQRFSQCFQGEVFSALTGVEGADAQIDGVGTILYSSPQRFHGTGGGQ